MYIQVLLKRMSYAWLKNTSGDFTSGCPHWWLARCPGDPESIQAQDSEGGVPEGVLGGRGC